MYVSLILSIICQVIVKSPNSHIVIYSMICIYKKKKIGGGGVNHNTTHIELYSTCLISFLFHIYFCTLSGRPGSYPDDDLI